MERYRAVKHRVCQRCGAVDPGGLLFHIAEGAGICHGRVEAVEYVPSTTYRGAVEERDEAVRLLREFGACEPYTGQPYDEVVAFLDRLGGR